MPEMFWTKSIKKAQKVKILRLKRSFRDRFWNRVNKGGPIPQHVPKLGRCWLWCGTAHRYGEVRWSGRKMLTHRAVWELSFGRIPKGKQVCHKCDNKICVNPEHLFLGSQRDNVIDSVNKGRWSASKLRPGDVIKIRKLRGKMMAKDIAKRFGVSGQAIGAIFAGYSWNGVR